ncbi:MAG: aromatic amino acid transport family protein [Pseudomonadota bacterium]
MNKTIGATLLMIGTCMGGGMLALPIATAAGGFYKAAAIIIFAWFFMTVGSFLVLEVNLYLPNKTNLISMSKSTLGRLGQIVAWISYCLVLYSGLCAYGAGGGGILQSLFFDLHIHLNITMSSILYIIILAAIVFAGTHWIDYSNRLFMIAKIAFLISLIALILPHSNPHKIIHGSTAKLIKQSALITAVAFTFSIIIPSMRYYLNSDIKKLKIAIILGGTIPLICYLLWIYAVQTTVPTYGPNGLIGMAHGNTTLQLAEALSNIANSDWLTTIAHLFISFCMITAFLTVSLSLSDFIADGFNKEKKGKGKFFVYGVTFIPVLVILTIAPNIFILGLKIASAFCIILVIILPTLMAWFGRYHRKIDKGLFRVPGGKPLLIITFLIGVLAILSSL